MNRRHLPHRLQRGFSIVEAMIAGLVLSFGTLALVGVQVALTRNADVAKQRTEATRLAQERMEQLRAYASAATLAGVSSYESLATGSDAPAPFTTGATYNTVYQREWDIRGAGTDVHREVSVVVRWTDRHAGAQDVRMTSVVSKTDHSLVGAILSNIGRPGYGDPVRRRNSNVPFPAVGIGNDRSKYEWPVTGVWYVFNDITADIEWDCGTTQPPGSTATPATPATLAAAGCTQVTGYVLAGYVGTRSVVGQNQNIDTVLNNWLAAPGVSCLLGNTTNVGSTNCSIENVIVANPNPPPCTPTPCTYAPLVINEDCPYIDSTTTPTQAQLDELRFYKCYATVIILSTQGSTAGWTGRLTFSPAPGGNQRICRYSHLVVDNAGVYTPAVTESINNQNYYAFLAANGNGPNSRCPTGTTQHQP